VGRQWRTAFRRFTALRAATARKKGLPRFAASCRYFRVVPDFVVLDELVVSELDPFVDGVVAKPLADPVVSDELPVVPLLVVPDADGLMPVVPPLVEPEPVVPEPAVPDVEPDPYVFGEVDFDPLVLPGLVVVERVDDDEELEVPVSRPDVLSRSEQAPSANVASVAATAMPSARVFICFIFTPLDAGRLQPGRNAGVPAPPERLRGDPVPSAMHVPRFSLGTQAAPCAGPPPSTREPCPRPLN
jgi:hypothetical protein